MKTLKNKHPPSPTTTLYKQRIILIHDTYIETDPIFFMPKRNIISLLWIKLNFKFVPNMIFSMGTFRRQFVKSPGVFLCGRDDWMVYEFFKQSWGSSLKRGIRIFHVTISVERILFMPRKSVMVTHCTLSDRWVTT